MYTHTYMVGKNQSRHYLIFSYIHSFTHPTGESNAERESYVILSVYTLFHENVTRSIEWVRVQLPEHNTPEVNDMIMLGKDMQSFN